MEETKTKETVWKSPYSVRGCRFFNLSKANGEKLARQTADWMQKNREDFFALYELVKEVRAVGYKGHLRDQVVARAYNTPTRFRDGTFEFAHAIWAGITRYMALMDPELIDNPIVFRPSHIDAYGLEPIDWLNVKEVA